MDSRERVFTALEHSEPDRIPVDFWASKGFRKKLEKELGVTYDEFLDQSEVDFRFIKGPEYTCPGLETRGGERLDIWGVPRRTVSVDLDDGVEEYKEVTVPPLQNAQTVEEIIQYTRWPSPDWFDYSVIEAQCDAVIDKGRVSVFMGDRLNRIAQLKPAMYLCGVDGILLKMAVDPEATREIFSRISGFYTAYLQRILESANGKIDIILTGDDFGSQNSLLMSPDMWNGFLRKGFAGFIDLIHSADAKAMHHTCGAVSPLIPGMIECGLDILQSIQPEAGGMDCENLKKEYGGSICFQGGISIQKTMPRGTEDEIRNEVSHLAQTMGKGGGYIFCTAHNIQADTPVRSAEILLDAYREFGRY